MAYSSFSDASFSFGNLFLNYGDKHNRKAVNDIFIHFKKLSFIQDMSGFHNKSSLFCKTYQQNCSAASTIITAEMLMNNFHFILSFMYVYQCFIIKVF